MTTPRLPTAAFLILAAFASHAIAQEKPGKKRSPIVDAHMHVWSGDPERFPFSHPFDPKFKAPKTAATVELLVEEMDQAGIDYCVLVQTVSHGWDNSYLAHCLKAHPKRFRGQGLIEPTDPKRAEKLEHCVKKLGLSGVRFSPLYYKGKDDWLNAKESEPLWQKAEELGAIFNFFIAAEQLPKLEEMIARFPKVKVVIDHLARVDLEAKDPQPDTKKLLALARYPNVWVKVSELSILSPSKKYPYKDTYPLVEKVVKAFGPDRLLWGTGFPGATRAEAGRPSLQEELDLITKHLPNLTAEERDKILGRNAMKLWGFDQPKVGRVIYYSGRVQGVGFRDKAVQIARDHPVTGWVKNLDDGRVQLVVEGPEDAVRDFTAAIREHWKRNIDKEQSEDTKATGKYKGFAIVY